MGMNGYMEPCYYKLGAGHPEEVTIDPFANTLEGRIQLDILEKHYRIQTQQNNQGDVNTSDLIGIVKVGGSDPRMGRIACIESCLRNEDE